MVKSKNKKAKPAINPKPNLVDLDDEPKFIELPDDYEEEDQSTSVPNAVKPAEKVEKKEAKEGTPKSRDEKLAPGKEKIAVQDQVQNGQHSKQESASNTTEFISRDLTDATEEEASVTGEAVKPAKDPAYINGTPVSAAEKASKKNDEDGEQKPQGDCEVCGHLAKSFCSGCKHVFYCKRDHQRSHWKRHKEDCKMLAKLPYRVERNDMLGRYLVATKDIAAGTLILNEMPMIVGPRQLTKPVCLGCHQEIKDAKSCRPCLRCSWPVCSDRCQDSAMHQPECRIINYGGSKVKIENFGHINMMYSCITVLRALALQEGPQEIWRDYTRFESHLKERMKTEIYTKVNKEKVVYFIHHYLKLMSKFSDLEILEACGKLDTNCFEIRQSGLNLRAMYRTACLMSHDCKPNTKHTFGRGLDINIYATTNIAAGDVISATYTQPLWCTINRREHLFMSKCFWCQCQRCKDPTELGTFLSTLLCQSCGGDVLMANPLDVTADWRCQKCSSLMTAEQVKAIHKAITDQIRALDRSNPEVLEKFIQANAMILPESHQLVKEIEYGLVSLFKTSLSSSMTNAQLLRKSYLCKQLLALADKIDPGLSKWRGQLLFELQSSTVILAQRAFQEKQISAFQAKEIFSEGASQLREAIEILSVEPDMKQDLEKEMQRLSEMLDEIDEE